MSTSGVLASIGIVLVHGGFVDGSGWAELIAQAARAVAASR